MTVKHYAAVFAIAILASFAGGAAQQKFAPKEITAQMFVVVDNDWNGKKRAEFGISPDGRPILRLYDKNGKIIWSANEARVYPAQK